MTTPEPETLEREKDKLWVSDAELIRRLGVPEKIMRANLQELDRPGTGFPRKQKLYGNRRWWPAVEDYFNRLYGSKVVEQPKRSARQ